MKLGPLGTATVKDSRLPGLIRGLCRHALDGALRQLAMRWAVLSGQNLWITVAEFDEVMDTRSRLAHATRYHLDGEGGPVSAARELCEPFLDGWNAAVHARGGAEPKGLREEITAAYKACTLLTEWGSEG
ncbi:MAG: hypothetical protein ACRDTH_20080 [Pseudonocardiaceae bacterium]